MKQDIKETIKVPDGVSVSVEKRIINVSGPKGNLQRPVSMSTFVVSQEAGKFIISTPKGTLREKRMINTLLSHVKNMIQGVQSGYTYELKICSGHFPMTVSMEGNQKIIIKNFLGEKVPRTAAIISGVQVKIEGDKIIVQSPDLEKAGQMAARIEKATLIKGRDRRIFQDGCYITKKAIEA